MKKIFSIIKPILVTIFMVFTVSAMAQDTLRTAPAFTLSDLNGKKVSLSDFKGKVVYLDIWASWCGPCLAEVSHAKKLHKQFKDNPDIVFINISFDHDTLQWKSKVESKEMSGIQLHSPKGKESSVMKNYDVKGIPRFVIIDKNGMIADYDAKRPSEKVAADLTRVLAQ